MAFDWQKAETPQVRELGWALYSPAIVDRLPPEAPTPWQPVADQGAMDLLAVLDKDSRPLVEHLDQRNDRRLGAYFESLWTFFLSQHPAYTFLASNFTIEAEGRTLGALDLLFEDHTLGQVIHAELALKFYLFHPAYPANATVLQHWIGPNPDDSLALKVAHLRDHQLPLSTSPAGQQQLHRAGLPGPDRKVALIKGRLFYPLHIDAPCQTSPINTDHLRGHWLPLEELERFMVQREGRWQLAARDHWMVPWSTGTHSATELLERVTQLMSQHSQPVMLRRLPTSSGGNQEMMAAEHYFVVGDHWPDSRNKGSDPA